jgi:hypothetical protein
MTRYNAGQKRAIAENFYSLADSAGIPRANVVTFADQQPGDQATADEVFALLDRLPTGTSRDLEAACDVLHKAYMAKKAQGDPRAAIALMYYGMRYLKLAFAHLDEHPDDCPF